MKTTARLRRKLFLSALVLGIVAGVLLTAYSLRQAQLNRDLLAAIRRDDTETAIELLNEGADANASQAVHLRWTVSPHRQESPLDRLRMLLLRQLRSPEQPVTALYLVYAPPFRRVAGPAPNSKGNVPSSTYSISVRGNNGARRVTFTHAEPRPENARLVKSLLDHGADPNLYPHRNGPLLMAIRLRHTDTARLLLEHHADANHTVENEVAPLFAADLETARLLIQHGADVNVRDSDGLTPLMLAAADRSDTSADRVELLLQSGADPNARDNYGQTPLMHAATVESARRMLDHQADIDARTPGGMTALMMTCMNDADPKLPQYLLDHGANISFKDDHGKTALDYASESVRIGKVMISTPDNGWQLRRYSLAKYLRDRLQSLTRRERDSAIRH